MAGDKYPNRNLIRNWITGTRKHKHNNLVLISHRGNIDGVDEAQENTPSYIQAALKKGFAVACDVIAAHGAFLLPTQSGYQPLPYALLSNPQMWFLATDGITLDALCAVNAHAVPVSAPVALTSVHYLWCMPGADLTTRAIAVFPEYAEAGWLESAEPAGVCSNEISRYL
jgi:hypothetical protein